jgi:hypothetical protein
MGKPFSNDPISEIISALSCLEMEPEPIPKHQQEPDNNGYLSDVDVWAKHCREHLIQAVKILQRRK